MNTYTLPRDFDLLSEPMQQRLQRRIAGRHQLKIERTSSKDIAARTS